jgi:hypothetical protein
MVRIGKKLKCNGVAEVGSDMTGVENLNRTTELNNDVCSKNGGDKDRKFYGKK